MTEGLTWLKISQAANSGRGEGPAWTAVCSTASTTWWFHPEGFFFFSFFFFFIALDNSCSLANVMNRLKQHKVCLQLSRTSLWRNVLNKDAAALFLCMWSPEELRAQRSDSRPNQDEHQLGIFFLYLVRPGFLVYRRR